MSESLGSLSSQEYDLLIIGGGVMGCAVARDAALRGLRVALFEKEDFGYGTSSRSTRLIHGGLRYLEIYDFGLVRQDLQEREILLKTAPHRVQPLPFLIPLYARSRAFRLKIRLGMWLYDLLSRGKSVPCHRMLSRSETLAIEPGLEPEGLQGGALYYDAQAPLPERICLDCVCEAAEHGATVRNHTQVIGLLREGSRVVGLQAQDTQTLETVEVHGRRTIHASGPWADKLADGWTERRETSRLRLTKGIHFAMPSASKNALVLFSPEDGRLLFVVPWLNRSWVGTTDTDFNGDLDTVHAVRREVRYLRDSIRPALPRADWEAVYYTCAGVRALVRAGTEEAPESAVSRKHRIHTGSEEEGLQGLMTILGGKLTAHRGIAEEAVSRLCREERWSARPCETARRPLPGGDFGSLEALRAESTRRCAEMGLREEQADNLVLLYGSRYTRLLDIAAQTPELARRIADPYPDIRAQIVYACREEFAGTLCDVMLRRTTLGFTPDQGVRALPSVLEEMARLKGWSAERAAQEEEAYRRHLVLTRAYRASSLD
jgi:glycerol-3-phosphate dehydrogenase